jgi:DNA-binding transcriptional LysR family regulator
MTPDWTLWQSFLAVAETGSLSAAARRLGLTQPTLGRHIAALEEALGLALFLRSPSGLVATPAARDLLAEAQGMAAAAAGLQRRAAELADGDSGTVRLAASDVIGAEVLPPVLADFARAHPRIAVELGLSNRPDDLLRREADLALRMFRPTQTGLRARRLGRITLGFYATEGYLARAGLPESAADLDRHILIGPDSAERLAGVELAGRPLTPERFAWRCNNDLAAIALLRAGVGIGVLQAPIAARDPSLRRLLPDLSFHLDIWLAMSEGLAASVPVRRLWDHLAAALPPLLRD